jgi:hypothetical protein
MRWIVLTVAALAATMTANVRVYDIPPYKCYEGWTALDGYVAEQFVACADSLVYAEFFAGQKPAHSEQGYRIEVLDGGTALLRGYATDTLQWAYVRANLSRIPGAPSLVRGKTYLLKVSHTGAQRVNYFFDPRNSYTYGAISAGGGEAQPPPQTTHDLVARVIGRMNPVDSISFACDEAYWWSQTGYIPNGTTLADRACTAGVKRVRLDLDWHLVQYDSPDSWHVTLLDSSLRTLQRSAGCQILALLANVPNWASTRVDTVWRHVPDPIETDSTRVPDTCIYCAPRGLQYAYNNDSNYLGRFLKRVVAYCDDSTLDIHDWECFNEINDEDTTDRTTGWWQHPNRYYAGDSVVTDTVGPGLHAMCSLYVRMAQVMDSAIRYGGPDTTHLHDRIGLNSMAAVNRATEDPDPRLYAGKEWLKEFYAVADSHFWNAITVHAYHEDGFDPFRPGELEDNAETLRAIMSEYGDYGELWNTEFGMPAICWWGQRKGETLATKEQSANYCCEMFTAAEGMKGLPGGSFDRNYWWYLRQPPVWGGGAWGLVDSNLDLNAEFYAFKQTSEQLTGKRFNGRMMTGDAGRDALVRMYEFEDTTTLKRTWVCWKNGGAGSGGLNVKLPVRTDSLAAESLAYTGTPPPFSAPVAPDGWLSLSLNERPAFVTEVTDTLRPDLRVDSVRYSPSPGPMYVKAWVTNHGSRATPRNPSGTQSYPTWAVLSRNGDSLAQQVYTDSIAVGHQVEFKFTLTSPPPDSTLYSVRVNPLQTYVELGTDDNSGYGLAAKP